MTDGEFHRQFQSQSLQSKSSDVTNVKLFQVIEIICRPNQNGKLLFTFSKNSKELFVPFFNYSVPDVLISSTQDTINNVIDTLA